MNPVDRRTFIGATGVALVGSATARETDAARHPGDDHRGACSIASGNGARAVERAMEMIRGGSDPVDAIVEGVGIVESDPNDMTVGYGGLPNEDGIVELDASVMHGPTHKAGAVAALRNIKNPAQVALKVLKRTDHVMIVGEGALRFARAHGFKEENLLTERARERWLRWKENLNPRDDWLDDDQRDLVAAENDPDLMFTYGTINCSAVTDNGDLAGVTTTSGLSFKIPGRVGDSPIIGAGMFVDNAIGAAGSTGRGEAVIQNCGAFAVVQQMERGLTPTEACLEALRTMARNTRQKRLLNESGHPNFNVSFYALRKDGAYGGACMRPGGSFQVHDGQQVQRFRCVPLFQ